MTSTNHEFQQDVRAGAAFTGTTYTTALRKMTSPLPQARLGVRLSERQMTGKIAAVLAEAAGLAYA